MSNIDSIKAISILVTGIDKHIANIDVMNKENLYEYRYKDLQNMNAIIRRCARCNREFIPNMRMQNTQIYCGDDCRYNSTVTTRKVLKQDSRYKQIDNLRKLIYERQYRARKDNKPISDIENKVFKSILNDIKKLTKDRKCITEYEFNKRYNNLVTLYKKYRRIKSINN